MRLHDPHRFRIEWSASSVRFFVDGSLVATHSVSIGSDLRPVLSDFRPFGAGVRTEWLRQGTYATAGTFTSRVLDGGPGTASWQTLVAQTTVPAGTTLAFDTRSGSTPQPDGAWSSWQALGGGGAISSPRGPVHPVPRSHDELGGGCDSDAAACRASLRGLLRTSGLGQASTFVGALSRCTRGASTSGPNDVVLPRRRPWPEAAL